jgi:hypothetical protein
MRHTELNVGWTYFLPSTGITKDEKIPDQTDSGEHKPISRWVS